MLRTRIMLTAIIGLVISGLSAQVGIGTTTPNPNTILDISSNQKGILIPRMTTAERDTNLEDDDEMTAPPADLIEGTMVYNTDANGFQYWNSTDGVWETVGTSSGGAAGNEGVVVMDFSPSYGIRPTPNFFSKLAVEGIRVDRDYSMGLPFTQTTTPGVVTDSLFVTNDFGNDVLLDFNEIDFDFNRSSTFWPENAPGNDKDDIWNQTTKTIYENGLVGQVHMWRITFEYSKASKDTTIQITLANPSSSFETNGQHRASEVDLGSGRYTAAVLLITVADSNSLPTVLGGSGNGYTIGFRTNGEVEDLAVTKITRISFLKD